MDSAQAYDDMMLRAAEEQGDTYEQEQGVVCEVCERTVDEVFVCEGCGEIYGCKSCMFFDHDWMSWFCDPGCVWEHERKLAKKRPDFKGVFND